jgi:hypothetical protein
MTNIAHNAPKFLPNYLDGITGKHTFALPKEKLGFTKCLSESE